MTQIFGNYFIQSTYIVIFDDFDLYVEKITSKSNN